MGDGGPLQLAVLSLVVICYWHCLVQKIYVNIYCVSCSPFFFFITNVLYHPYDPIYGACICNLIATQHKFGSNIVHVTLCDLCFVLLHSLENCLIKKNPEVRKYTTIIGNLWLCIGFFVCCKCVYDVGQVGQFGLDFTGKLVTPAEPVEQELCMCQSQPTIVLQVVPKIML